MARMKRNVSNTGRIQSQNTVEHLNFGETSKNDKNIGFAWLLHNKTTLGCPLMVLRERWVGVQTILNSMENCRIFITWA